jgi:hypothetical protein
VSLGRATGCLVLFLTRALMGASGHTLLSYISQFSSDLSVTLPKGTDFR